ncbi:hypothetical protein SELMODRAFT_420516 [Selaginella moellendorffii]|uniref:HAT C-terminal dimerisation domain-containing protein n=1 Tax=Selaginella moellendorffii TaxID=88036 RepID=D8SC89_SELML|nr:hypothetical protein SELMODRAFT_420516 [Selaginella moellendorffii]
MVERIDQQPEKATGAYSPRPLYLVTDSWKIVCVAFSCNVQLTCLFCNATDILYSKLKSVVSAINTRVLTDDANVAINNIPGSGNTLHDQIWHIKRKRGLSAICHALNLVLMSWLSILSGNSSNLSLLGLEPIITCSGDYGKSVEHCRAWCLNPRYREDRNRQEATAAFNRVQHRFYPNVEDAHKLNQEYFAYVDGTSPFSIADSRDAQELLEKGKDGNSPWHVWASAVSFSCDSRAMLWRFACYILGLTTLNSEAEQNFSTYSNVLTLKRNKLHLEQAEKLVHIYQNHRIWDRKESETSHSSAMWIGGEFDIPKENDSPVVGGSGTGHTTTGFRSYAEVDTDNSMSKDEDDDFDRDSNLRLIVCNTMHNSEISCLEDDMD